MKMCGHSRNGNTYFSFYIQRCGRNLRSAIANDEDVCRGETISKFLDLDKCHSTRASFLEKKNRFEDGISQCYLSLHLSFQFLQRQHNRWELFVTKSRKIRESHLKWNNIIFIQFPCKRLWLKYWIFDKKNQKLRSSWTIFARVMRIVT